MAYSIFHYTMDNELFIQTRWLYKIQKRKNTEKSRKKYVENQKRRKEKMHKNKMHIFFCILYGYLQTQSMSLNIQMLVHEPEIRTMILTNLWKVSEMKCFIPSFFCENDVEFPQTKD